MFFSQKKNKMKIQFLSFLILLSLEHFVQTAKKHATKCPEYPLNHDEELVISDLKLRIERREEISKEFF